MKKEINFVTEYIGSFLVQKPADRPEDEHKKPMPGLAISDVAKFKKSLSGCMWKKYSKHWHPQKPLRGHAFRSIAIERVNSRIDPLIHEALGDASFSPEMKEKIISKLPPELTLWVDPMEVSCRFGEHGSIGVLFSLSRADDTTSDYESEGSSVNSSPSRSPPRTQLEYQQQQFEYQQHSSPPRTQLEYQQQQFEYQQQQSHSISPFPTQYSGGCRRQAAMGSRCSSQLINRYHTHHSMQAPPPTVGFA